jgi:general secretion pathway protein D
MLANPCKKFLVPVRTFIVLLMIIGMPQVVMSAESVTLNLKDVEIGTLINTVSELTGKNFVVDPRVKGRVTVVSSTPLNKDEIYQIFLSILDVHGFATIPSGNVIKIVPDVKAKSESIPTQSGKINLKGDQVVTRIIRVRNVSAAQLVPILRPLIPQQGHLAAYPSTNVLLLIDRADNVDRVAKIINRIDQVSDSDIEIIPLKHASATEIVRVMTGLTQSGGKPKAEGDDIRFIADERTNSILLSGETSARLRYSALIAHLDTPLESGGYTRVIYLRYAKAKDMVTVLSGVSKTLEQEVKGQTKGGSGLGPNISIQADESSNALVITAPNEIFRSLQRVVEQLDIRRAQVLVEAIIAEVTLDKTRQLGVQWLVDGTPGGKGAVGAINFGGDSNISNIAATIDSGGVPSIGDGVFIGVGRFESSTVNFAAVLQALSNDADSNILSTPSLVTLDNQQAEIIVGENVPFVTGEYSSTSGTSSSVNPFRTIQRQDVGLTLRVTPQINEGDAIKLDIEQEVSNVIPSAAGASDLTTSKRSIKTTVMVEDGRTIVLGGLIDDTLQQTNQRVPLLGDIPLLGRLFRYDSTTKKKRNLMVFLRPVIMRDAATESNVTEGKYTYMRAQQIEQMQKGVSLLDDSVTPVLPEKLPSIPKPFNQTPSNPQQPANSN